MVGSLPTPSEVREVVVDPITPSRLFAAGPAGVFRADDASDEGQTWIKADQGLPAGEVVDLALHPTDLDRIYAGTPDGRVFRSDDGGDRWRQLP
jgi:photosystem II stability/assembly factor-like uncharacterized protein